MDVLLKIIAGVVALYAYLLPTLVAMKKNKRDASRICALNLLAGWTIIGWTVALARTMSYGANPAQVTVMPRHEQAKYTQSAGNPAF